MKATATRTAKSAKSANVVKAALDSMKGKKATGKKVKTKAKGPSPVVRKILEQMNLLAQPTRADEQRRVAPTLEEVRARSRAARKLDKLFAVNPKMPIDFAAANPKGVKPDPNYVIAATRAIRLGYNCEYAHYCGVLKMTGLEPVYGKLHRYVWKDDQIEIEWFEPRMSMPH